jgi:Ca2+-transporting ATPase
MRFGNEAFVPLLPVQLLWMNFVTDGFPAIALALDPLHPTAMKQPPRSPEQPVLHTRLFLFLLLMSGLITAAAMIACVIGLKTSPVLAQTMTLTMLIVLQLVRVQMVRAKYRLGLFSNPWLLVAITSSFVLQLFIIYLPPLQIIFGTTALSLKEWMILAGLAGVTWIVGSVINKIFKENPAHV